MARLRVEVVYALPGAEDAVRVSLAAGATLRDAVRASGLLLRHPEIDPALRAVGVYGALKPADSPAADGDRVEIYRPLQLDPKEVRRRRAARQRARRTRV